LNFNLHLLLFSLEAVNCYVFEFVNSLLSLKFSGMDEAEEKISSNENEQEEEEEEFAVSKFDLIEEKE
jgi:hypothetical protein